MKFMLKQFTAQHLRMSFVVELLLVPRLFGSCLGSLLLFFCNQLHHSPVRGCLTLPRILQPSRQAVWKAAEQTYVCASNACNQQLLYEQSDMLQGCNF